ncbi:hypothetical protein [Oscillibacter sp. 1-3]|uniref:hypothetical protein n=1 Tax=Oscillibacter sp. 1-3 TaxID=1235797 RepID=UPI000339119F|nr:hypothetical protein [Oscillibacter sp. 1-3]EOS67464.1 hypothetical protein C816_00497 [Oscillibacter sp. 1-3]
MELFSVNGEYVCKVYKGFNMQKLEEALSNRLSMRKSSFSEQYSLKIFRDLFRYARDLRQEYQEYYWEEYGSFSEFLYKREFWATSSIKEAALTESETVLKLRISSSSYNLDTLLSYDEYDNSFIEIVTQILEEIDL